jgi:two-component system sensor kinase FixL
LERANSKLVDEMAQRSRVDARLHELQEELFHATRLTTAGEMAATLAHELNQPLTSTANFVNTARRMHAAGISNGDLDDVLSEAAAEVLRAGQIIQRLREFVTRGDTERNVESVRELIEDASALALSGSKALAAKLAFHFDPRAPFVVADRIQIRQVLTNLMRNALDALLEVERRELVVTTALQEDGLIEFAISDTGPGLGDLATSRLFQPFVSTKQNGMGLGLSICRSIVTAHGGKLDGETRKEGGATFRFTLPAAQGNQDDS